MLSTATGLMNVCFLFLTSVIKRTAIMLQLINPWKPTNLAIKTIRGINFIKTPLFKEEFIESTMDYVPRDGDIILASYPKTGSTWIQYIMHQIITKGETFPGFQEMTYKTWPFVEMVGASVLDELESPRKYKHHYPYQMVQKNENSKVVYIYRHPEDTLISYHQFAEGVLGTSIDFDYLFEAFLRGLASYGCYFEHVMSYWNRRHDKNLLMVAYEGLHRDKRGEILRIAKFLGHHHHESLVEDQKLLEDILDKTTFEYMKKNLVFNTSQHWEGEARDVEFLRKGKVGDGKRVMSQDQLRRLRELAEKKMKGTEILEEWYS